MVMVNTMDIQETATACADLARVRCSWHKVSISKDTFQEIEKAVEAALLPYADDSQILDRQPTATGEVLSVKDQESV